MAVFPTLAGVSALLSQTSSLRGYRYVFVSDEGSVYGSVSAPTTEDLRLAAVGIVTVVNLRTARYYGREGCWLPIPLAKIASPWIDDARCPARHVR